MTDAPEFRHNVLLLETIAPPADEYLRSNSQVIFAKTPASGTDHIDNLPISAIVTRGKGQVNRSLIDACSGLQVIARCGVGLDNVDIAHASSKGIRVVNAPGSNSATVAEHALSLMLMLQRKMAVAANQVKAGNWGYRATYDGDDLRGKRLGILGFGNIGQRVAKLASAFGMDVQFWDVRTLKSEFDQVSFDAIIEHSHIISIHLPLLESTKGLLSLDALSKAKNKPIIINTARGGLIKDADVLSGLAQGIIAGFGADVLEVGTPPAGYALLERDEVLITPHSASLTQTTYAEMCMLTVQNTIDLLHHRSIDERYIFNRADVVSD